MAQNKDCDCIDVQLKEKRSVKICGNNLGDLLLRVFAVAVIFAIADKLSE